MITKQTIIKFRAWIFTALSSIILALGIWMWNMAWSGVLHAMDDRIVEKIDKSLDEFEIRQMTPRYMLLNIKDKHPNIPLTPDERIELDILKERMKELKGNTNTNES